MRYMLTDDLWAVMEPLVEQAKQHNGGQEPTIPDRVFFEAILYWARTGIPWRDLPSTPGLLPSRPPADDQRDRTWSVRPGLRTSVHP